jgi:hypothetical protein
VLGFFYPLLVVTRIKLRWLPTKPDRDDEGESCSDFLGENLLNPMSRSCSDFLGAVIQYGISHAIL